MARVKRKATCHVSKRAPAVGRDTAPGYSAAQILLTKRAPNPPLESPSPMYQRAEAKPRHKRFNPLTSFVDCEGSEQDGEDTAEIRDCKTSPEKKFPPGCLWNLAPYIPCIIEEQGAEERWGGGDDQRRVRVRAAGGVCMCETTRGRVYRVRVGLT